jgi:hypothetical protein
MVELMHGAVTWALVGLIWVVQLVIYPQFGSVGRAEFVTYHADYTRRISWVVGPLMLAEIGSAGWIWSNGERGIWFLISLGLLAVNWISTALIQVPLHRKLDRGFEPEAHRALVRTNWLRTAAWTGRGLLAVYGLG